LPPFNSPTPEQAFLAKNYDENAKKPDRDPRGAFRNPAELTGAAGIVGPLGSSSFNLPNVERALTDMEVGIGGHALGSSANPDPSRRVGRAAGRPATSGLAAVATSPTSQIGRPPVSPTAIVGSPSPTGGQTQHEVLQNFFQRLLSRDREGASATAPTKTTLPNANGSPSGEDESSS
jgi:dynein light intermediate chain 1